MQKEIFVNILQNRSKESFIVIDFELSSDKKNNKKNKNNKSNKNIKNTVLKPNIVIYKEIKGDDNKIVKYLTKNFHIIELKKPYLYHLYHIIYTIMKKHTQYYSWMRKLDLPKMNSFAKLDHKKLYLFIPKVDEICNRVTSQYFQLKEVNKIFTDRLKHVLTVIKQKDNVGKGENVDKEVEETLLKIIGSLFTESKHLLDLNGLRSKNPCLCLSKHNHKDFICYLKKSNKKDNKDKDKQPEFTIECENFRSNSYRTMMWETIIEEKSIIYSGVKFEEHMIYTIGVDHFYTAIFNNSIISSLWKGNSIVQPLTAYSCKNRGYVVYDNSKDRTPINSLLRRKDNKGDYKLINSTLLQLFGSLMELQDPNDFMLLHKNLNGNTVLVENGDEDFAVYETEIDYELIESIMKQFENRELTQLEDEFLKWLNDKYGFEYDFDVKDYQEEDDQEDANQEDNDQKDYENEDEDEDEEDNNDDNSNDNMAGGRYEEDDNNKSNNNKNNNNQKNNNSKMDSFKVNMIKKMRVLLSDFSNSAVTTFVDNNKKMRLYSTTDKVIGEEESQIEQIDYDKYVDIESLYTLDEYTPNNVWFYTSFDSYYFMISYLLDEVNNRSFFKNRYYRWIWSSMWENEDSANKLKGKLLQSEKSKNRSEKVLELLQGVILKNSVTHSLFLRLYYLQKQKLI